MLDSEVGQLMKMSLSPQIDVRQRGGGWVEFGGKTVRYVQAVDGGGVFDRYTASLKNGSLAGDGA